MNLRVVLLAALLAGFGVAIVVYKIVALGYEIVPRSTEDRWSVQVMVRYRGAGDNAQARVLLPFDRRERQQIYDERIIAEGGSFDVLTQDGNRVGVLAGRPGSPSSLSYRFAVHLRSGDESLPTEEEAALHQPTPGSIWLAPERYIPSDDLRFRARLEEINRPGAGPVETLRHIFEYVADETSDIDLGPNADALRALQTERGGSLGQTRLLVALARAAGIPARVMVGVDLQEGTVGSVSHFAEVQLADRWIPVDPHAGHLAHMPRGRLVLHRGDAAPITSTAVEELNFQITALKEEVSQHRLYQRRAADSGRLLDKVSLYKLPVHTQMTLRVLLLIPFGALIVAVFRNMIGVPTFGTFMPVLLGLAFIETTLMLGIGLLLVIIGVGWIFRRLLDWMQLLMVPRLSFLLTVVILIIVGISLLSDEAGMSAGLYAAAFPIVIITATIERFSVMIVEEGPRNAAKATLGTLIVAVACYALLMSQTLQRTVLAFPELLFPVLGALLLIGRYTGYRLSEWTRFAAFKRGFGGA